MTLGPLLDIADESEAFDRLVAGLREGERAEAYASASMRPYLLAALFDAERGLRSRPALIVAADDIGARDLAAPSAPTSRRAWSGTTPRAGRATSRTSPPPHLVGLRIGALDALTAGEAGDGDGAPIVVASAVALAERVPDASLRPVGFALSRGEEVDLGDVSELLVEAGYQRVDQVEERGQFAVRGGILDVFPATEERAARLELFGDEIESIRWFSTFTQRSLGEAERVELDPAAELPSSTASWPRSQPTTRMESAPMSPSCSPWTRSRRRWTCSRGDGRCDRGCRGARARAARPLGAT